MRWFLINSRNTNELNNSLSVMIKGVKRSKPEPKAPEWFSSWVKNQYEKDIKHINNRLDNLDKRLDNVVKLNKLKE